MGWGGFPLRRVVEVPPLFEPAVQPDDLVGRNAGLLGSLPEPDGGVEDRFGGSLGTYSVLFCPGGNPREDGERTARRPRLSRENIAKTAF